MSFWDRGRNLRAMLGAVKVIASIDKSAGEPICTANAAPQGVDTGM